jgi:hypothetical protein
LSGFAADAVDAADHGCVVDGSWTRARNPLELRGQPH